MKLIVHVLGRPVATLEKVGDFKSVVTYHPEAAAEDFVSLTMPVRTQSWEWDDELPPIFRMNLPEGYLLQVLQEKFGPVIGAHPLNLLTVIGRNMVGRLKVAPPDAPLDEEVQPLDVQELLQGDNSAEAFTALVYEYATSGVSGVVPKFLDTEKPARFSQHRKTTICTHRHIVKGSSAELPYVALNEHLCMEVTRKVIPTAKTEISRDGRALVVHRFDVDEAGQPKYGLEDFCALLGLRPANKYETNWERIAKAVRENVPGPRQYETFERLAAIILLTYALRNADCHSKNIALLYSSREDVHLAPAYDMLTTAAYTGMATAPGLGFMGKKTWLPGKSLQKFLVSTFNIPLRVQNGLIEKISDAVSDTSPAVREAMEQHPEFRDIGKRMLLAWKEGVEALRNKHTYALPNWEPAPALQGFSDPEPLPSTVKVMGKSQNLRGIIS